MPFILKNADDFPTFFLTFTTMLLTKENQIDIADVDRILSTFCSWARGEICTNLAFWKSFNRFLIGLLSLSYRYFDGGYIGDYLCKKCGLDLGKLLKDLLLRLESVDHKVASEWCNTLNILAHSTSKDLHEVNPVLLKIRSTCMLPEELFEWVSRLPESASYEYLAAGTLMGNLLSFCSTKDASLVVSSTEMIAVQVGKVLVQLTKRGKSVHGRLSSIVLAKLVIQGHSSGILSHCNLDADLYVTMFDSLLESLFFCCNMSNASDTPEHALLAEWSVAALKDIYESAKGVDGVSADRLIQKRAARIVAKLMIDSFDPTKTIGDKAIFHSYIGDFLSLLLEGAGNLTWAREAIQHSILVHATGCTLSVRASNALKSVFSSLGHSYPEECSHTAKVTTGTRNWVVLTDGGECGVFISDCFRKKGCGPCSVLEY